MFSASPLLRQRLSNFARQQRSGGSTQEELDSLGFFICLVKFSFYFAIQCHGFEVIFPKYFSYYWQFVSSLFLTSSFSFELSTSRRRRSYVKVWRKIFEKFPLLYEDIVFNMFFTFYLIICKQIRLKWFIWKNLLNGLTKYVFKIQT